MLTILTPTYNRGKYLERVYNSLLAQTDQNFEWLLIDDGSTDDTDEIVRKLTEKHEHTFSFRFYSKENGGKHTVLNYAHDFINGELVCIVDSDDWLVNTAVEKILRYWAIYNNRADVCGMTFMRGYDSKNSISKINEVDGAIISNHIDYRVNAERRGDCFEIVRSSLFKEILFPEFKGEKFLGESYLWNQLGFVYNTVYINEILYICQYLEGGLTKSGRLLRIKCPLGGMADCKTYFIKKEHRKVKFKILLKEAWLFICYGKFAGLKTKDIIKSSGRKLLITSNLLFGFLLYFYWKHKFY